jgi:hypothetical protein
MFPVRNNFPWFNNRFERHISSLKDSIDRSHSGHEKLVFREGDNDHFLGGKPGEPIIFPCKVTHPNVSLSLFRQTRETTVQFQNEYFKVFRTDSTPENAFGRCQMRVKTFVLFTFKRFGIPRRRLKIRDGPSTLKKDWHWRTPQFSTRPIIFVLDICLLSTENESASNILVENLANFGDGSSRRIKQTPPMFYALH